MLIRVDISAGLVNVLDGALCLLVFTAMAPGLVGLLLLGRGLASSSGRGPTCSNL